MRRLIKIEGSEFELSGDAFDLLPGFEFVFHGLDVGFADEGELDAPVGPIPLLNLPTIVSNISRRFQKFYDCQSFPTPILIKIIFEIIHSK